MSESGEVLIGASVSFAAFASGAYKLSEKLKAGARFTSEVCKFLFYQNVGYFNYNGTYAAQVASVQNPLTRQTNDNVLTYDISLDYKMVGNIAGEAKPR